MTTNNNHSIRVALVLTRNIESDSSFGRIKVLKDILAALDDEFDVTILRLHSLLETRRVRDLLTIIRKWLSGLPSGHLVPLQTALYSIPSEIDRLVRVLTTGKFAAIYIDGVRCETLLHELRKFLPDTRVVVDFDDLMSRRMYELAQRRVPLSLGYLQNSFPRPLRWLLQGPMSRMIERYETTALTRAEREMVREADAVVLVSPAERDILRHRITGEKRQAIFAVLPMASTCRKPLQSSGQYRFIFIGSDQLTQNRLSIDFLVGLWRTLIPATSLHIYGRQKRSLPDAAGVHWHGYVKDLSDVYNAGSILLLPSLLPGGIKTKVIESWSFGCPVLGNASAFEGLDIPDYPLIRLETDWTEYLLNPADHSEIWTSAAVMGNTYARTALSPERHRELWKALMKA
jgi:glycosyltransferase involved in cell wall biosynthesis